MLVVTGGAGMIGSNLICSLNKIGRKDIIVVDNLKDGKKVKNICDLDFYDFIDKENFINYLNKPNPFPKIEAIFHQGACSSTTEWDGRYIMQNNFEYSKELLNWSQENSSQFIYASSASVYGNGRKGFQPIRECELPINMYAFSKFQFDQYFRAIKKDTSSQVVGLRYFNVYGPRETHKESMASTAFHFNNQILSSNKCRLFKGQDGYRNGEQKRDFIYVEDCVSVNIWFLKNPEVSGIFNVGTGKAQSFNNMANEVINWHKIKNKKEYSIEYIEFPKDLIGSYQNYTQADLTNLRKVGYQKEFHDLSSGIKKYLDFLNTT